MAISIEMATDAGAASRGPVRDDRAAVDKAMSLLVSFGAQASIGLGVSELARRSALSKSTAFRVLGHLERSGVVERVGRNYRLGARMHELGRDVDAAAHDRVRDVVMPYLTDLFVATRQTVHLAALDGTDVVYLAKLYGHRPVPSPSRIGARVPAYCTGVGKALLAHQPDVLDIVLGTRLHAVTARTIVEPADLLSAVTRIRCEGIAFDDEEVRPGLSCVAMPILSPTGRPVAAVSITGATGQIDTRAQASVLRRVCAEATRAIARGEVTARQHASA